MNRFGFMFSNIFENVVIKMLTLRDFAVMSWILLCIKINPQTYISYEGNCKDNPYTWNVYCNGIL